MARAVVLLSGGLDSATALAMWLAAGNAVHTALTIDYGQLSVAAERRVSQALAERFGVRHEVLTMSWLGALAAAAGAAIVPGGAELPDRSEAAAPGDAETARAVWVPARNLVFLATAAAYAEAHGCDTVVAGFNREEAATFADNSPEFVGAMNQVLEHATRTALTVDSPTLGLEKRDIAKAAFQHGLRPTDLWSCYAGGDTPCGKCESCVRSQAAWGAVTPTNNT